MKVFELMSSLSEMPSGAEVEFNALMPIEELIKGGVEMQLDGKDCYSLNKRIVDIEQPSESTVYLYSD